MLERASDVELPRSRPHRLWHSRSHHLRSTSRLALCGVLAALVGGCGAAAQPAGAPAAEPAADYPASPAYPKADELDSVDEALRAFDWAERELGATLGSFGASSADAPDGPYAAPPPPSAGQAPAAEQRSVRKWGEADRCQVACRALESMQRSAERLCELAGPEAPRCRAVEKRVERARRMVERVCPDCEAAR